MTKSHGGPRPGAGRKPRRDGRTSYSIRVWLYSSEYEEILDETTPDDRRAILINAARERSDWRRAKELAQTD